LSIENAFPQYRGAYMTGSYWKPMLVIGIPVLVDIGGPNVTLRTGIVGKKPSRVKMPPSGL